MQFTVDWGDGSPAESYTGSGDITPIYHEYDDYGEYSVNITATTGDCHFAGFICNNELMTYFDISSCAELVYLDCSSNNLGYLDLNNNTKLKHLKCDDTNINSLNLNNNTELEHLECQNTNINSLNLSNCTELKHLECHNNNINPLNLSNNTVLEYLNCNNNLLTALNLNSNTVLIHLECSNMVLHSLDLSSNAELKYLDCSGIMISNGLDLNNNSKLEYLDCSGIMLYNLDLSSNTLLEYLDCSVTALNNLDLSNNTALKYLYCWNLSYLNNLDLNNNIALEYLNCALCPITFLDLSHNTVLQELRCNNNHLNSLDLNNNVLLEYLDCSNNHFQLSDLFTFSKINCYKLFGTQTLTSQTVYVEDILFSEESEFDGIFTDYIVIKNDLLPAPEEDYTITDGKIIFHKIGNYTVTMTNEGIISDDDYATEVVIGLAVGTNSLSETFKSNIQAYPNPTSGELRVRNYDLQPIAYDLQLFNIMGRIQDVQWIIVHDEWQTDISHLKSGVYFLRINNEVIRILKK
ncbi:MAG: T9SS type A sorting domain-containing protein [Bacteroidales bacterium]|nr:T9SS type A sorting domain-containing protein [Bacteroidales bacterium]